MHCAIEHCFRRNWPEDWRRWRDDKESWEIRNLWALPAMLHMQFLTGWQDELDFRMVTLCDE